MSGITQKCPKTARRIHRNKTLSIDLKRGHGKKLCYKLVIAAQTQTSVW